MKFHILATPVDAFLLPCGQKLGAIAFASEFFRNDDYVYMEPIPDDRTN